MRFHCLQAPQHWFRESQFLRPGVVMRIPGARASVSASAEGTLSKCHLRTWPFSLDKVRADAILERSKEAGELNSHTCPWNTRVKLVFPEQFKWLAWFKVLYFLPREAHEKIRPRTKDSSRVFLWYLLYARHWLHVSPQGKLWPREVKWLAWCHTVSGRAGIWTQVLWLQNIPHS